MRIEEKRTMIFRPFGPDIVIESPEQLVAAGITIHHQVIERCWGKNGIQRYEQARKILTSQGRKGINMNGSINFR